MLNKIRFKVEDNYIIFEPFVRKKIKPIKIQLKEEKYANEGKLLIRG